MNTDLQWMADRIVLAGADGVAVDGKQCSLPSDLSLEARQDRLADVLYKELYIRSMGRTVRASALADVNDFQAGLLGAIKTNRVWQPGWTVSSTEPDGSLMVTKNGVAFHAPRGEVKPGGPLPELARCTVRVPAAQLGSLPGFLVVVGMDDLPAGAPVSRFYWHLKAEGAYAFLAAATSLLNLSKIPFKLKVVSNPDDYVRADAGVIYVARRDLPTMVAVVGRVYATVADSLRPETPLFTKRLARGLGAADDPGNGLSFGQAICRLVAGAILGMPAREVDSVAARRAAVAAVFEANGLHWRRPHLVDPRGHGDPYRPLKVQAARHRPGRPQTGKSESFLSIAEEIGRSLCARAMWSATGDRCNWMERANGAVERNGFARATLAALNYSFYDGLSGIALFLAELFRQTGMEIFRDTAIGSLRSACAQVTAAGEDHARPGLHTGIAGLCYSARRVRVLTGLLEGDELAEQMIRVLMARRMMPTEDDLIDGKAGVILALLRLHAETEAASLHHWASDLGHQLSAAIEAFSEAAGAEFATGLAHGGAGMGLALFELHAATGIPRFLAAARQAFAIEDRHFDAGERNWFDPQLKVESGLSRFPKSWCRGAPGIGLARLRAAAIGGGEGEAYLATAAIALTTNASELSRLLSLDCFDATLCHGAGGLIDIMLTASLVTGDRSLRRKTREYARRFVRRRADWRSGYVSGTDNPTLMLGSAGIGLLCLRLNNPRGVISPLLL